MGLAIFQIIFGLICVILGITAIFIECSLRELGTGIWCGVMFAVAGSSGMAASLKKTNAMINTTMVLSIISATVAGIACYFSSGAAVSEQLCYYNYFPEYDLNGTRVRDEDYYDCDTHYGGRVAVDSMLAFVAFAELVFAILQSAFCCGAYCCNQKPSASTMYIAVRTSEEGGQGSPMGVIQSEAAQQMAPSGLEFVPHYPSKFLFG
ncbi:membrane-spanning 4-domains subfamily A member 4A-like [Ptychodera flava]|uniref:membrane-spanning 4-domains subfamily A member 4A-like n=1 Tax=Ptychodera flava TaxID=63121 RepID=UPI00396AA54C